MKALRVMGTVIVLMIGWRLRHRPILGPLALALAGTCLYRLWSGSTGRVGIALAMAYDALERAVTQPDPMTLSYRATLASHR